MSLSINSILEKSASDYYISYDSPENVKIDRSVETLKNRILKHFPIDVNSVIEFGSYKRDTILPRKFDENSDVDLMVVFNHSEKQVSPATYRNYLIDFCKGIYPTSQMYRSTPTVVLELEHIKYDLVPTYKQQYSFYSSVKYFIPENDTNWMETDPNSFNNELTNVNVQHHSNIKKLIRLLKAWNAKVGYPLNSFQLEKEIVNCFFGNCITLENYFFHFIDSMSEYRFNNTNAQQKIAALKENKIKVVLALSQNDSTSATQWLKHILP
jgi:predicted nucleotidyltransferase